MGEGGTMDPGGDGGDFEAFVAARGPRLLRMAWLLTGDAYLAEDLLQTVPAKVWLTWHRVAEDLSVEDTAARLRARHGQEPVRKGPAHAAGGAARGRRGR